jgi:uncharacterized OB-fold protein
VTANRPLPLLSDVNRFFWTSGSDGRLRFLRCRECRAWAHPPQPACRSCGATDLAPETVSGRAKVLGWTINHQLWHPAFPPPYVIAVVAMAEDEGVRLTTNIVDVDHEQLFVGMEVDVVFHQDDDVWIPLFRPAEDSQ